MAPARGTVIDSGAAYGRPHQNYNYLLLPDFCTGDKIRNFKEINW
jgi:hypothetical protein